MYQNFVSWHYRVGHVLFSKLKFLSDSVSKLQIKRPTDTSVCTVCPLAKQKCLSFISNKNVLACLFDKIHCDLWDPFSVSA